MKDERVRENVSGDSESGEADELLCVIGGEGKGDCISRSSVGVGSVEKVQHT